MWFEPACLALGTLHMEGIIALERADGQSDLGLIVVVWTIWVADVV